MGRKIRFCLLYRDMWQSSGKYVPRVDQLTKVAGPIIDMGCFARVETNGGGFEQINLLFGENPNRAVREWTKPFNEVGIQTQMLERGLNGIRMYPVPSDVRRLMFHLKKKQGTDIARSFDGLNDVQNLELSVKYALEGGMIPQGALCITYSPVHTVEYYIKMADDLVEMGAKEICIKDMAGIGRPVSLGKIVKGIKSRHPNILVQFHSHSGPGFSVASILEGVEAGAEIVDVAMEPISWGTGHADLLTIHAMLKDAGFEVPEINMNAYMQVRSLTQEFMDDFLGYYMSPRNRLMNSLLIGSGLPGGMMGSLMADLQTNLEGVNKWLTKNNQPELSQDDLLIKLFDEVEFIWPKLGYPPLVTPYSQYVKNVALMNVLQLIKGKERWSMVSDNTWDMILGRNGKLPGPVDPELINLATSQGKEVFTGSPQELYPDDLDTFKKEMKDNSWDFGQDDEELFELSMHPEQYRAYKSGQAKQAFEKDLKEKKAPPVTREPAQTGQPSEQPRTLQVEVDGEKFQVKIEYGTETNGSPSKNENGAAVHPHNEVNNFKEITAPIEGTFMLTKESGEKAIKIGDIIKTGDLIGYIESMKVYNAITADKNGEVVEICSRNGDHVIEDEVLIKIV